MVDFLPIFGRFENLLNRHLGLHVDEEGSLVFGALPLVGSVTVVVLLQLTTPLPRLVGAQVFEADAALVQGGASNWIPRLG